MAIIERERQQLPLFHMIMSLIDGPLAAVFLTTKLCCLVLHDCHFYVPGLIFLCDLVSTQHCCYFLYNFFFIFLFCELVRFMLFHTTPLTSEFLLNIWRKSSVLVPDIFFADTEFLVLLSYLPLLLLVADVSAVSEVPPLSGFINHPQLLSPSCCSVPPPTCHHHHDFLSIPLLFFTFSFVPSFISPSCLSF